MVDPDRDRGRVTADRPLVTDALDVVTLLCDSDSKPSKHVRIGSYASGCGILLLDCESPALKHRNPDVAALGEVLQQRRTVSADDFLVKHVGRIELEMSR